MSSGIYIATAGAVAQSSALDTTANNIANASTTGYRADRVSFREALGAARSIDTSLVDVAATREDAQPGALESTGNALDLALEGDGVFVIDTANGPRYTRAGNFCLDEQGRVVTQQGLPVRGAGGAITIPPGTQSVAVATDGTVSADGTVVGQLELARFAPAQLAREGDSLLRATGAPQPGEAPLVRSGMLESSNVNVVRGVVDLVKVSRTYESLMRVIQGYHDVESRAARDLGGPK